MRKLIAGLVATIATLSVVAPASASGEIICEGDNVSVAMLVGRLPVLSVLRTTVLVGDKVWSSDQTVTPGMPIAIGQQFEDEQHLRVDFTDDNVEKVIGRIRTFTLREGDEAMTAGVFAMKGEGVFAVDCSLRG